MSTLIREERPRADFDITGAVLIIGVIAVPLATALALPGDLAHKVHLVLHGLCAQLPSHSLNLGGDRLPLDARMTGIYLGATVTICCLIVAGRLRAVGRPNTSVLALIVFGVLAMAGDGIVGLLTDLQWAHPYEPSNSVRLATGMLAGTALGAGLCHLFVMTVWAKPERQRAMIASAWEIFAIWGTSEAIAVLLLTGLPVLFAPVAIALVASAVVVFSMLNASLVMLLTNRAWTVRQGSELKRPLFFAFLLSFLTIGSLSAMRIVAEAYDLIPKLT
jgi:uncharacterized membrane protein